MEYLLENFKTSLFVACEDSTFHIGNKYIQVFMIDICQNTELLKKKNNITHANSMYYIAYKISA